MIPKPLARQAATAALDFERLVVAHASLGTVIGLTLPGEDHPCFASIIVGRDHGVQLYRDLDAETALRALANSFVRKGEEQSRRERPNCEVWSITISPPAAVPPKLRTISALAGRTGRSIPAFMVTPAGKQTREPYTGELRVMLAALRSLLLAHERDIRPVSLFGSETVAIPMLEVQGQGRDLQVIPRDELPFRPPQPTTAGPTDDDLAELPRIDREWHAAFHSVHPDDPQRKVLAIADAETGRPVNVVALRRIDDAAPGVAELRLTCLGTNIAGVPGLPRRIVCQQQELSDAVATALGSAGVEYAVDPELVVLPELVERLRSTARHMEDPDAVPAANDDAGWDAVKRRLAQRAQERKEWAAHTRGPRTQFFGEAIDPRQTGHPFAPAAYTEWFLVHYRGKKGRRTVAERLLEEALPEPERILLQARCDARVSLWRVERVDESLVALRDHFTDEEMEVPGRMHVRTLREGELIPGSVASLPGGNALSLLGPPIPAVLIDKALGHLADLGSPTAEGLATSPHLLGRLWRWLPGHLAADGEPLQPQMAVFSFEDRNALTKALSARPEIDREGGLWHWVLRREGMAFPLAVFELQPGELRAYLSSAQQMVVLQEWLASVPGVAFVRTETQPPGEAASSAEESSGTGH